MRNNLQDLDTDRLDRCELDVVVEGVNEMASRHEATLVPHILFDVHDHHERRLLDFFTQ